MIYRWKYRTPEDFDDLLMSSDGAYLTGLWFEGSRDEGKQNPEACECLLPVFRESIAWLDAYFDGRPPETIPAVRMQNLTPFREAVLNILKDIPWGTTTTYGAIASRLAQERGIRRMSAQAVGNAVGWNPVCIMIPCHRVIGADGSMTGYGGGLENKKQLLRHEQKGLLSGTVPTGETTGEAGSA